MQISKREFLKKLGLLGAVGATGAAFGDDYVATAAKLPPGSVGDPDNVWFGQRIFPIPHTVEDGPSCSLKDGKVYMPAREVVGGGPAGCAAAVSAARTGAKVALVEQSGSLGGLFTNGMVLIMLATSRREDGGRWTFLTKGVCEEFMDRAAAMGPKVSFCRTGKGKGECHYQPTVDPEAAKYLMDRMIEESKVEMFFHAYGVDVIQDGDRTLGVVFQSKQGLQAILAKQVVDCTGDGDIAFAAGCGFRQITHGIGFVTRLGNMDRITADRSPDNLGVDAYGRRKSWPLRGNEGNRSAAWNGSLGPKGDGLSVRDLSKAEIFHRRYWWERVAEMQKTPGWEEVYITNTCSQIGPRATRLIATEQIVGSDFVKAGKVPADTVGWCGGEGFAVPYGQLVPKGVDNLLCAGRMLGDPSTIDTFRLIAPCMVTGEAAGTAAALAAQKGVVPRNLDVTLLRKTLLAAGVYL